MKKRWALAISLDRMAAYRRLSSCPQQAAAFLRLPPTAVESAIITPVRRSDLPTTARTDEWSVEARLHGSLVADGDRCALIELEGRGIFYARDGWKWPWQESRVDDSFMAVYIELSHSNEAAILEEFAKRWADRVSWRARTADALLRHLRSLPG